MIGMALFDVSPETVGALRVMALEASVLVVFEILAIVFFLQAAWSEPDARESAERLLRNRLFVVGYVLLGLLTPLLLMVALARGMLQPDSTALAVSGIGAALGLIGGLILRQGVLRFGALPTLNLGGFEFRRVDRPKEPKPDMGLLPPQ